MLGSKGDGLEKVDIAVMRQGPQLNADDADMLVEPVVEKEIKEALFSMCNFKDP